MFSPMEFHVIPEQPGGPYETAWGWTAIFGVHSGMAAESGTHGAEFAVPVVIVQTPMSLGPVWGALWL